MKKLSIVASLAGFALALGAGVAFLPVSATSAVADDVTYVAKVGDTSYETLGSAINASQDGDKVELINNVKLGVTETILVEEKDITLDLAGYTIDADYSEAEEVVWAVVKADKGANLTLTGNGTINYVGSRINGNTMLLWARGADGVSTITVENGTYVNDSDAEYTTQMIYASGNGVINILGGSFTNANTDACEMFNVQNNTQSKINVQGGSFSCFNETDDNQATAEAMGSFAADGYEVVETLSGTYAAVTEEVAEAVKKEDNSTVLAGNDLAAAIATVADKGTVVLTQNVSAGQIDAIYDSVAKNFTLDLNGKTVSATANRLLRTYGDVTIKNGTIESNVESGRCVETRSNGSLVLDGVTLKATSVAGTNTQALTIGGDCGAGNVVNVKITNSTIDAGDSGYAITTFNPTSMKIENSSLNGYATIYLKAKSSSQGSAGSKVEVVNSDLNSTAYMHTGENDEFAAIVFEDENISVSVDESSTIVAKDSQAVLFQAPDEDGNYYAGIGNTNNIVEINGTVEADTVFLGADEVSEVTVANAVATINNVPYVTLQSAVNAAEDGDIVTLLKDVDLGDGFIHINKSITLEGNRYAITSAGMWGIYISGDEVDVTLESVSVTSTHYALMISASNSSVEINYGGYYAWGALVVLSNNVDVSIRETVLVGTNPYNNGAMNNYATIVVEGDNANIQMYGGQVQAESKGDNSEQWIFWTGNNQAKNIYANFDDVTITKAADSDILCYSPENGNEIYLPAEYAEDLIAEGWAVSVVNGEVTVITVADYKAEAVAKLEALKAKYEATNVYSTYGEIALSDILSYYTSAIDDVEVSDNGWDPDALEEIDEIVLNASVDMDNVLDLYDEFTAKYNAELDLSNYMAVKGVSVDEFVEGIELFIEENDGYDPTEELASAADELTIRLNLLAVYGIVDEIAANKAEALATAKTDAIAAIYGEDNADEDYVTALMIAKINAAETEAEVEVAKLEALAEIEEVKAAEQAASDAAEALANAKEAAIEALGEAYAARINAAATVEEVTLVKQIILSEIEQAKALDSKLDELKSDLDGIILDAEEMENLLDESVSSVLNGAIADLDKKIDDLDDYIQNTLKGYVDELEDKADSILGYVDSVESEIATLKSNVASIKGVTDGLNTKLSQIKADTESLIASFELLNETTLPEAKQAILNDIAAKAEALKAEIDAVEEQADDLQDSIDDVESKADSLKNSVNTKAQELQDAIAAGNTDVKNTITTGEADDKDMIIMILAIVSIVVGIAAVMLVAVVMKKVSVKKPKTTEEQIRENIVKKEVVTCNKCGAMLKVKNDGSTYMCPTCNNLFRLHEVDVEVKKNDTENK